MSLELIKDMKKEIEQLKGIEEGNKQAMDALKSEIKGFKEDSEERKRKFEVDSIGSDDVSKAKKQGSDLYLKSVILGRDVKSFGDEYNKVSSVIEKAIKPADLGNWLAEEFSNRVLEDLELEMRVEALFDKITMPKNRQQFSVPARNGNLTSYLIQPAVDAVESAYSTNKVTFETSRFKSFVSIADQADVEAVTAVLDLSRKELVRSLVRGMEDALVNGDTAYGTANDVKKAFDGVRKYGRANVVDNGGNGISAASILATRKAMGVYGMNLNDLVIIVNPQVAYNLLGLPEVITVDKYGAKATIHSGEVGRIYGMPILVSEYIANTLKDDGTDDTSGTKTVMMIVNKRYFAVADRGSVMLETDRNIVNSTNLLVAHRDVDFKKLLTNANTAVAELVNIAP